MREEIYSIIFTKTSEKQYKFFSGKVQKEIALTLESIARDPLLGKPLQGPLKGLRSKRVGKYRMVYKQEKKQLVIIVINIDHRRSVYRKK